MVQVAAYCRVSTDREDQANSFVSQQQYFKEYIERCPSWNLYKIYADEGITGTSTKNRTAFNQMMEDARQGCFQLILTKEVSRFSRNILDTISYTRELKALGIAVVFANDNINTLEPDAELRLSIMASLAQEESRRTSSRVKWGQSRRMEQGVVFGRSLLGYDVKGGDLIVNPKEAELVKLIFSKYGLEKKGTTVIARELREAGYRTHRGNVRWSPSHIVKILKNEKYVGDLVQKKTFTPDYLNHAKKTNHGEEKLVVLVNHHEPIVDRELWELVQTELKKRSRSEKKTAGHSNRYIFSGKIKCGQCGASFVSRKKTYRSGTSYRYWSCYTAISEGTRRLDTNGCKVGCDVGKTLREELAMEMLRQSLSALQLDREALIQKITGLVLEVLEVGRADQQASQRSLEHDIHLLCQKKADALDAFFSRQISKEDLDLVIARYEHETEFLRKKLTAMQAEQDQSACGTASLCEQVTMIVDGRSDSEVFWKNILDHMIVHKNKTVEVRLQALPHRFQFTLEPASAKSLCESTS